VSACASSSTTASGPWTAACARSSPSTTEWSPPSTIGTTPARTTGSSCSAICAAVRSALPGVTVRSPASTTESAPKTSISFTGCHGRSSSDASRIPAGPNRAPGRMDVAVSNGMPSTAASTPSNVSETWGQRANVRMPVYRGAARPSAGP
jgi:hypothetical protein